ncbi:MAG: hypothetical protein A2Z20_04420 [Bdellovibrionales bacterium RBG_16_40_8]|nr:MAG: hypothetical protein A2Z20_04420 [Bdellovibrionales bacterium RBG_16_40_8]
MKIIKVISIVVLVLLLGLGVWLFRLNSTMQERISHGWFRPPVEIYSRGELIRVREQLGFGQLTMLLEKLHFRERVEDQTLLPNDYALLDFRQCAEALGEPFTGQISHCVFLRTPESSFGAQRSSRTILIGFDESSTVVGIFAGTPLKAVEQVELMPQLFAQFYDGEPILRKIIKIGDVPLECLQAVTAIEDSQFLEHKGVSITGLARAFLRNLLAGRFAQGGSTITQQLIKNYFLTPEKTLRRKISELAMAPLLEMNLDKDEILETYLNVIYMGQRGPFQVIGFASASEYYFNKRLDKLELPECALLAAVVNSPGRYSPYAHPDRAKSRRNLVLDRMVETNMITPAQAIKAKKFPLVLVNETRLTEPAPYYTQAIFREIGKLGISSESGLRIFTALDVSAQDMAQKKVLAHVLKLEKNNTKIAAIKASGKDLQASIIVVDTKSGEVIALVGGRQFVKTQYNRVLDAHRQVGSVMKPFVYLTALEGRDENGDPYTPLTMVDDLRFVYKYEGQSWSPQNYDKGYHGSVPIFYALKNSLNASTANVGIQVGLKNIVDVAKRAGITSEIQPFPSLTLGAFEIYPWEVAESTLTIARMGERIPLTFLRSVEDLSGKQIFLAETKSERVFAPQTVAVLVGMMKQTLRTGTARMSKILGFKYPAAGKTGTTSDTKDTWFIGFTPYILTVTWTGYDDNTPTNLTGASGALPLWVDFMKDFTAKYQPDDFAWPEGVAKFQLTPEEYKKLVPNAEPYELESPTELVK